MDNLTFITELTKALAWPITVIIAILVLRPVLFKLAPLLQRLRYKEIELQFGQQIEEARAEVAADLPLVEEEVAVSPFQERLLKLAEVSPRAAVLESWRRLEAALTKAARKRQVPADSPPRNPREAVRLLQQHDAIPSSSASVIGEMRHLRNQAAHAPEFALSSSSAIEYGNLAWALSRELEED